ncbi:MAG: hypothetical protein JXA20_05605 [Spirochaetes bacterium]|nr:hypothetical protein [Spirochaetota bacterium]
MYTVIDFLVKNDYSNFVKIFLGIAGAVGWFIAFRIKRVYSKKDKRLMIYSDALERLEKISQTYSQAYTKEFANASTELYISILKNPNDSTNQLINYLRVIQKLSEKGMDIASDMFTQFTKFRLVASKESIRLFDIYRNESTSFANKILEMQKGMIGSLSNPEAIQQHQNNLMMEYQRKGEELGKHYKQLEDQMRKDVGFD